MGKKDQLINSEAVMRQRMQALDAGNIQSGIYAIDGDQKAMDDAMGILANPNAGAGPLAGLDEMAAQAEQGMLASQRLGNPSDPAVAAMMKIQEARRQQQMGAPYAMDLPGQTPIDQIEQSVVAPVQEAAQPPSAPLDNNMADQVTEGERGRIDWQAPEDTQAFSQSDFYPGPGVASDQYDTGLVLTPRATQIPMGALSKAADIIAKRQTRLDQAANDFMKSVTFGKTADPYQRNYVAVSRQAHDEFVQGVANMYTGGNVKRAWREIYRNPELLGKWKALNAELEALGQQGQYFFNSAATYLENGADPKKQYATSAEGRKLANEIIYALGTLRATDNLGGDIRKLNALGANFEKVMSRDMYFQENIKPLILGDLYKTAIKGPDGKPYVVTNSRGKEVYYVSQGTVAYYDTMKEAQAESMVAQGIMNTKAEAMDYLNKMLPAVEEWKTTTVTPYRGGGSGGGGNTIKAGAGGVQRNIPSSSIMKWAPNETGVPVGTPVQVDHMPLYEITSGRRTDPGKKTFIKPDGKDVDLLPVGVEYVPSEGRYYIVGRDADAVERYKSKYAQGAANLEEDGSNTKENSQGNTSEFSIKNIPMMAVPLDINSERFKTFFGLSLEDIYREFGKVPGTAATNQAATTTPKRKLY